MLPADKCLCAGYYGNIALDIIFRLVENAELFFLQCLVYLKDKSLFKKLFFVQFLVVHCKG